MSVDNDICLIVVDFAGLSTNCEDIKSFIRPHLKLEKKNINCTFTSKQRS
ncbi:hypothetical protein BDF21DRAFT_421696 [Thamnidium elegans]|nr:hypothetical protein BDF21DRAFT_421696 [Thamnidium elegans]